MSSREMTRDEISKAHRDLLFLLGKYVHRVRESESVDFIDASGPSGQSVELTDREQTAVRMAADIYEKFGIDWEKENND